MGKRRCRLVVAAGIFGTALCASLSFSGAAVAADTCASRGCVDVVAVNGLIDEIEADNIVDTLRAAEASGNVEAVVFQMDSPGSAVSDARLNEVAAAIEDSAVPVTMWVGPSGAVALGGAAELVAVADFSSIAPGARIGQIGTQRLRVNRFGELFRGDDLRERDLEGKRAVEAGAVDGFAAIVREHIVNIKGVRSTITKVDGDQRQTPVALVRFSKLPLGTQVMHTVASPSVAYLLVASGLALLLFEFYTAGVGIAGVVGAGFTVLAGYGVAALPHNTWALVVVVLSMLAFAFDVQSGVPRVWTGIGMGMFLVGSAFLFVEFRPTWLALVAGIVGIAATMYSGMPSMVRARFGAPTIDREWMVGETGFAVTDVDPEGTVRIQGVLWRARTTVSSTPVRVGETLRVAAVDGLMLQVESEPGAVADRRGVRQSDVGNVD